MKRGIILLLIAILLISSVSALNACCEKTKSGEYCEYTDESECSTDGQSAYATCEQTSYCQIGCCYSSDSGTCYKATARARCEAETDATWTSSYQCNIEQCELGCCVLADQAFFVTEVKCKQTATQLGNVSMSYDAESESEYECLNSVKNLEFGCCVQGGDAAFTTRDNCPTASTEPTADFKEDGFHAEMLCSNDLLSTECAKQQYTSCYQGKVYWYDSCGNRENIYSSDKTSSYNNGYALKEEESCTINGAYDKNCGNCNYAEGSICGKDEDGVMGDGEFTCVDINCYETYEDETSPLSGGDKLNGESWCIFDSFVGEGKDAVGSRNYRHLCINGEEVTEPCEDFRGEICITGVLSKDVLGTLEALHLSDSNDYIEGACRDNRYEDCSDCNSLDSDIERQECCANEDYRDCYWLAGDVQTVERGTQTAQTKATAEAEKELIEQTPHGQCVPQVPPGLKFWTDNGDAGTASSNEECSQANTQCTATWRLGGWKRAFGGKTNSKNWNLVEENPAGCTEREWFVAQNTYCKSLGDCGAYYNYLGKAGYDGFSSNIFDEKFFFSYEELDAQDLDSWDYLVNVGGEEIKYYGFKSRYYYTNPALYFGIGSAVAGGVSNVVACSKAHAAGVEEDTNNLDFSVFSQLSSAVTGLGGIANKLGGSVVGIEAITGNVELVQLDETGMNEIKIENEDTGTDSLSNKEGSSDSGKTFCKEKGYTIELNSDNTYMYKCVSATEQKPCNFKTSTVFDTVYAINNPELTEICKEKKEEEKKKEQSPTTAMGFMKGVGCFMTGVTPIVGLFGNPSGAKPGTNWEEAITKQATEKGTDANKAISLIKQAKGAKTVSRVANAAAIVSAAYLLVEYAFDNETTITYNVECNMWQPPKGGEDCELCNNKEKPCSEYRCKSLGAACELINEGTSDETCISTYVNDVNSPLITPNQELLSRNYTIEQTLIESNKGYIVNEEIKTFTPIQLGLTTDEPAQCKWSNEPGIEYDEMQNVFGSELYLYNHALMFSLGDEVTNEELMALNKGIYNIYIRCSDYNGNANERDYFIRFHVQPSPDLSPPEIMFTSMNQGTYLAYGINETEFSLYTNEPSKCRWDDEDTGYEIMENEMECSDSGFEQSSVYFGTYPCTTVLNTNENEMSYYYFKCRDNYGNTNEESYKYSTKASDDSLLITSVSPEGSLYNTTFTLEAETEGGAEDGTSICAFSTTTNEYNDMIQFLNTNSSRHSQELNLFTGEFTLYVTCQDLAGNQAKNSTKVSVEVDQAGPLIENLYIDEIFQELVIELKEPATCEYAGEPFEFGEGTLMDGSGTETQSTGLVLPIYYVKCKDSYTNVASYILDISLWS